MVSNDEASRQVWLDASNGALAGMKAGTIAIDSSTLTPAWVAELAHADQERYRSQARLERGVRHRYVERSSHL
jgi:3-hydroxyisobutyrate dehydrogenase-like beta-hydroxyacid dehydrogenase